MNAQYYVEVPETYPREYKLAEQLPQSARSSRYQFAVTPAFVVRTKMYGSHEKPQP